MEPHGKNTPNNVIAIIPARYASTRLPGKLLLPIAGRPLILHTLEQAAKSRNISRVLVATDDPRIFSVVQESGGEAVMTSADHRSGSDRIAEVAETLPVDSIIVNIQGDEPVISPITIDRAIDALIGDANAEIATTCESIDEAADLEDANIVKVVTNADGYAVYFSRSAIPFPREAVIRNGTLKDAVRNEPDLLSVFRKHTGLYVYRRESLLKLSRLPPSSLEHVEMLEQLRALENSMRIKVVEVTDSSIGVDTAEDLERVRRQIEANGGSQKRDARG